MKQLYSSLIALLFYCSTVTGQNNFLTINVTPPDSVIVCGNASTFSVTVTNTSGDPITAHTLTAALPPGTQYLPGTLTGTGVSENNITNLSAPVFNLPNLPNQGDAVTLTFGATSNCQLLNYFLDGNDIEAGFVANYAGGFDVATSPTWFVKYPILNFQSITNQTFGGSPGETFTRTFTIRNNGNAPLFNSISFYDEFQPGVTVIPPSSPPGILSPGKYEVEVSDFTPYGNGNGVLEPGESVTISITYQIVDCFSPKASFFNVRWGCGGDTCLTSFATGGITLIPRQPNITITNQTAQVPLCADGSPQSNTIRIVNNGQGPATNFSIQFNTSNNGWSIIDTASVTYTLGLGGAPVHPTFNQITNHTNAATGNRACLSGLGVQQVRLFGFNFGTLAAGDTIYVTFQMRHCCSSVTGCASTNYFMGSIAYNLSWTDQCGLNPVSTSATLRNNNQFNISGGGRSTNPPSGNVQPGTPGCASIQLGSGLNWALGTFNPTVASQGGYVQWVLTIPAGLSFSAGSLSWTSLNGTPWVPSSIVTAPGGGGSTIVTAQFPITQANGNPPAGFTVSNSTLGFCVNAACGASGTYTVNSNMSLVLNPTCPTPCTIAAVCDNINISTACPDPCTNGGMVFNSFTYKRINYGQPDLVAPFGLPDGAGTADSNTVRTDRQMYLDTIRSAFVGTVVTTVANPNWVRGFVVDTNSQGARLTLLSASVRVWDASTGTTLTCNNLTPTITTNGNARRWVYCISPAVLALTCPSFAGFQYEDGDSVWLTAQYVVSTNIGAALSNYNLAPRFYLSNTGVVTSTTEPATVSRFQCGTQIGNGTLYGYAISGGNNSTTNFNGCNTNTIEDFYQFQVGPTLYGDYFPNEYRRWMAPDSFRVVTPAGYTFVSAEYQYTRQTNNFGSTTVGYNATTPATVTATAVQFQSRLLLQDNGGILPVGTSWRLNYRLTYQASCSAPDSLNATYQSFYSRNAALTAAGVASSVTRTAVDPMIHRKPILNLTSPLPIAEAVDSVVEWTFTLQNLSSQATSTNTWFALQLPPSISLTSVVDIATNLPVTPVGGLYQLGTVNTVASRSFRIRARITLCRRDSITIRAGWNCPGYPASVAAYPCPTQIALRRLYVEPHLAKPIVTILQQPTDSIDLCDILTFEAEVTNAEVGTGYSNIFRMLLPAGGGFTYIPGSAEIQYPTSGGYVAISAPTVSGTMFSWNISAIQATIGANGLRGIREPALNTYRIRFQARTNCSFRSGSRVTFQARCNSPCGTVVNGYVNSNYLYVRGGTVPYTTTIIVESPDTIRPCASNEREFKVKVINLGPGTTGAADNIFFNLDPNANYEAGSFVGIHNAPPNPNPGSTIVSSQRQLEWTMPAGVVPNDSVVFTFRITTDGIPCGTMPLTLSSVLNSSLPCPSLSTTCNLSLLTGTRNDTTELSNPDISLSNVTGLQTQHVGFDFSFDFANSGDSAYAGQPFTFNYYLDSNGDGVLDGGDVLIGSSVYNAGVLPGGSYSQADFFANTVLSATHIPQDFIIATNPATSPCLCSQITFPISDMAVLPVEFLSMTANPAGRDAVRVAWQVVQRPGIAHYRIERGTNLGALLPVGTVGANGTMHQPTEYAFTDTDVPAGQWYYRVVGVDADGAETPSQLASVRLVAESRIVVGPNPTQRYVFVQGELPPSNAITVWVSDLTGRTLPVAAETQQANVLRVDLLGLAAGTYVLHIQNGTSIQHFNVLVVE